MKTGVLLIALSILLPALSHSAQIFGSLKRQRGAPVAGAVEINCSGQIYRGQSDANGSYSVFVQRQEKCSFTVRYENRASNPVPIFSYSDPTRYDFELLPNGDLKRR